ncbi:hypothetical protein TA3x_005807 (plasmid) [Tundrisphaera sp. TA3]|uniref:hypothetical protein n=1 Tax=Tundrisphaera sp. TA3 TaxID=3435775 RepID=UPI003EBA443F
MSDLIASVTDLTAKDPLLLLAGAVALVIVLAAFYRGYWVVATHLVVFAFMKLILMVLGMGLIAMPWLVLRAMFGPVDERATAFLWSTIIAACWVVFLRVVLTDNAIVRFAKKLTINGELPE